MPGSGCEMSAVTTHHTVFKKRYLLNHLVSRFRSFITEILWQKYLTVNAGKGRVAIFTQAGNCQTGSLNFSLMFCVLVWAEKVVTIVKNILKSKVAVHLSCRFMVESC